MLIVSLLVFRTGKVPAWTELARYEHLHLQIHSCSVTEVSERNPCVLPFSAITAPLITKAACQKRRELSA